MRGNGGNEMEQRCSSLPRQSNDTVNRREVNCQRAQMAWGSAWVRTGLWSRMWLFRKCTYIFHLASAYLGHSSNKHARLSSFNNPDVFALWHQIIYSPEVSDLQNAWHNLLVRTAEPETFRSAALFFTLQATSAPPVTDSHCWNKSFQVSWGFEACGEPFMFRGKNCFSIGVKGWCKDGVCVCVCFYIYI